MKVPSNVVRCKVDNGPIVYPSIGNPYRCQTCGAVLDGRSPGINERWDESYGYLVEVEPEEDPRDTEEEISDLYLALYTFASILGDGLTAVHLGGSFTCSEADRIAKALMEGGHKREAMTFLKGHASGDDDPDDVHPDIKDFEAYVLELAGKPVPELIDVPEPDAPAKASEPPVVTADDLLKAMNLD
ncbi:hypothetical protein AB0E27_31370 [Streptomyces sparsogenes]|uniref:hypothetical protein n=1 Tax=Streptomyces sparsogenes TaxID=67365 RepID=UPI0033FB578D